MTLLIAARAWLLTSAPLAAYATGGVFPLRKAQGTVGPTVELQVISEAGLESHDGLGPFITRLQVRCAASTYDKADVLRQMVRTRLIPGTGVWGTLAVQRVHVTPVVFDGIDPESGWYFCTRDYKVWHESES
jgi:hypothetical protein